MVAAAYLWAHAQMNHDLAGFHPYVPFETLGLDRAGRAFTMLGVVPDWFRLFLWPAHLSAEYGPPAFPVVNDFQSYQIPGAIALIGFLGLGIISWKRAPAVSFGIWFTVITLLPTSNLIVPSGILLAERTLFLPSVGMMIAFCAVVPWVYARAQSRSLRVVAATAALVILGLGVWRSLARTRVWKDDDSLFAASVIDAPYVYRTHFMLGAWKLSQKRKVEGEREYRLAMALYDKDPYVYYSLGEEYREWSMYEPAIAMFRHALDVDTTMYEARARLALSLAGLGRWDEANREARLALAENTLSVKAMLGILRRSAAVKKRGSIGLLDSGRAVPDSGKVRRPSQITMPVAPPGTVPKKSKPPT
jgi:hypothetical protein